MTRSLASPPRSPYRILGLMSYADHFATWLEIDLGAIRSNVRRCREITGVNGMAGVQVRAAEAAAGANGGRARLHLKVDTGMTRLGAHPGEALGIARALSAWKALVFEGTFPHFARADEPDSPTTEIQERRFREVIAAIAGAGLRPGIVHASNSAAAIYRPSARFDLVRVGVGMYGR